MIITGATVTDPVPVVTSGLPSTVSLTTPYVDPPFTTRATSISQMYSVVWERDIQFMYDIGRSPNITPIAVVIRNNTMNTDLDIHLDLPSYITTTVGDTLLLQKDGIARFMVGFNESAAQNLVGTGAQIFTTDLSITVVPIDVEGPVYVRTNLDPLTLA